MNHNITKMKTQEKKLLFGCIKFMIILIILIIFMNLIYIKLIQNNKLIYRSEIFYYDYINNKDTNEIKIAILGDSHARDGLNPKFIENSYNFGSSGESMTWSTYY